MERKEQIEKMRELLGEFPTGMLVTYGTDDRPHARPMKITSLGEDLLLTFVTRLDSLKVEEIRRRENVAITLQSVGAFVSLTGVATVVTDVNKKRNVWNTATDLWFDDPEDPEAALIEVQPETVDYWDYRGINALKIAFGRFIAAATGESPEPDPTTRGHFSI